MLIPAWQSFLILGRSLAVLSQIKRRLYRNIDIHAGDTRWTQMHLVIQFIDLFMPYNLIYLFALWLQSIPFHGVPFGLLGSNESKRPNSLGYLHEWELEEIHRIHIF